MADDKTPASQDHAGHEHFGHVHAAHDHQAHIENPKHNHAKHYHNHDHSHGHGHDGHDHSHAPAVTADNERRIRLVFILTASYAVIQAIGGWIAGSLALIADSGHMISDAAALLLALIAYRVAARPANERRSYGYSRVRVLAALANGATLLLLVAWISYEAIMRISTPAEVMAWPMLIIAAIGLGVNLVGAWMLQGGQQGDSNLHGAYLHVLGDLLGSVGAIAAAIGIMLTGWVILDPILSIFVALLVVRSAWSLVRKSLDVLLQSTPEGVDCAALTAEIAAMPEVDEVGHMHIWSLSDDDMIGSLHVTPARDSDPLSLPARIAARLKDRHPGLHLTVQVDPPGQLISH